MLAGVDPLRGGIERVSALLASEFINQGSNVYSVTSFVDNESIYTKSFTLPEPYKVSAANTEYIRHLVETLKIDFLFATTMTHDTMFYNLEPLYGDVKIITHYHSSPVGVHSRIHKLENKRISNNKWFKDIAFCVNKYRVKKKYDGIGRISDKIVMLTSSLVPELIRIADFPDHKICVIHNPLTFPRIGFDVSTKKHSIVWVGRICESEKRISSLLNIWKHASAEIPDWNLQILGGGYELEKWQSVAADMCLERIEFLGFCNPLPYYDNASIYVMTSNTEGLPMTLIEAMSRSCVPVLFNSFPAASDIIDDGENGYLVRPFRDYEYARKLVELAQNDAARAKMAEKAYNKTALFDIKLIIDQWYSLFEELQCKEN